MKIQVTIKTVYGNELIYPVDKYAKLFADLISKKTLTERHLQVIRELGIEVELVNAYQLKLGKE